MTTTTRKPAAKSAAASKPAASKATGAHIPDAPTGARAATKGAVSTAQMHAESAGGSLEHFGEPGATLNPMDPAAPNYRFKPAAEDAALYAEGHIDQGTGAQQATPVLNPIPEGGNGEEAGLTWGDENVALGRRLTVSRGKDEGSDTVTTHEEIVPHGATEAQVAAARARLQRRTAA